MKIDQALRQRILDLCQEQNITLQELGQASSISPNEFVDLVNGINEHTYIETLDIIFDALHTNAADFFGSNLFLNLDKS